jgi:hypothetical protein
VDRHYDGSVVQPFPDDLIRLTQQDRTTLAVASAAFQGKVLGYLAGMGLTDVRIDWEHLTYTEQPDADLTERTDAALTGGQADQASTEERE